jgi:hypothetical protein
VENLKHPIEVRRRTHKISPHVLPIFLDIDIATPIMNRPMRTDAVHFRNLEIFIKYKLMCQIIIGEPINTLHLSTLLRIHHLRRRLKLLQLILTSNADQLFSQPIDLILAVKPDLGIGGLVRRNMLL